MPGAGVYELHRAAFFGDEDIARRRFKREGPRPCETAETGSDKGRGVLHLYRFAKGEGAIGSRGAGGRRAIPRCGAGAACEGEGRQYAGGQENLAHAFWNTLN